MEHSWNFRDEITLKVEWHEVYTAINKLENQVSDVCVFAGMRWEVQPMKKQKGNCGYRRRFGGRRADYMVFYLQG